jgi:hypothetical protein
MSQFVWQPWKDNIQTTRTPERRSRAIYLQHSKLIPQMGSGFPRRLPGRFLCFAPISYISPQNPCIFGPIYQFPRFAEIAQLEGMWLIIELQHIGIAIHDENGPEFDFVALKLDGDTL